MTTLETVYATLFVAAAVGVVVALLVTAKIHGCLSRVHPETWTKLGAPSFPANARLRNGLAFLRFLHSRQYEELGDPQLTRLCKFLAAFHVSYAVVLVAAFAIFVVLSFG